MSARRALPLVLCVAACGSTPEREWHDALAGAAGYLFANQADDGAIRSETYGVLRPGHSITAVSLFALSLCPPEIVARHRQATRRAFAFLEAATSERGAIGTGGIVTDYPCYTSAFYLLALVRLQPERWEILAARQRRFLESIQLTEQHGWTQDDPEYGGFGFGGIAPSKPLGGEDSNISTTAWAVDALRAAGAKPQDACIEAARVFVLRCQQTVPAGDAPAGGFCFAPRPSAPELYARISKAGLHPLPNGERIGIAYYSATMDGLRALLCCGDGPGSPPFELVEKWIAARGTQGWKRGGIYTRNPKMAAAMTYYSDAVAARVWHGGFVPVPGDHEHDFSVTPGQRTDGSWRNAADLMKEDDPLVTTPLVMIAMATRGRG